MNRVIRIGCNEAGLGQAPIRNRTRSWGPDWPLEMTVPGVLGWEVVVLVALAVTQGQSSALVTGGGVLDLDGVEQLFPVVCELSDPGRLVVRPRADGLNCDDSRSQLLL